MARYEDGQRFWEITRAGASITQRAGKLGNRGRTTTRSFAAEREARDTYVILIREHERAGYAEVAVEAAGDAALAPPAAPPPELTDLEAAIDDDPYDAAAYAVYGDALQRQGDPRGELIALQLGEAAAAAGRLLAAQAPALLGPLATFVADVRNPDAPPLRWRFGFIHRIELDFEKQREATAMLARVLAHPSGRFVAEVTGRMQLHADAQAILTQLERVQPASLREIELVVRDRVGQLVLNSAPFPRLERISLVASRLDLEGLHLPRARRAKFVARATSEAAIAAIVAAPWPELERLELGLHECDADFVDVKPLLERDDLPKLTHLKIRGSAFAGAISRALIDTPIGRGLEVLDLCHGEINPGDAERLARAAASFPALRELWLPLDRLRAQDREALAKVAKHVISDRRAPIDPFQ